MWKKANEEKRVPSVEDIIAEELQQVIYDYISEGLNAKDLELSEEDFQKFMDDHTFEVIVKDRKFGED